MAGEIRQAVVTHDHDDPGVIHQEPVLMREIRRDQRLEAGESGAAAGVEAGLMLALGNDPGRLGLIVCMTAVSIVWLLTSGGIAAALRIGELPAMIAIMFDVIRRPRTA